MLTKRNLEGNKVEVTFRMPPLDGVVELSLRGDFNDWAVKGVPLRQESDGGWVTSLVLDAGKSYRFRYYDNQGTWHNDWEADAYVPNDYGSDDCIVDLTAVRKPPPGRGKKTAKPGPEAKPKGTPGRPKKAGAAGGPSDTKHAR